MWTISKQFSFDASHRLSGLAEGHKCMRLHGHTYTVEVRLRGTLDADGFVLDYGLLDPFAAWLNRTVDHRHLNDLVPFQPSAENLARWFTEMLEEQVELPQGVEVEAVGVSETSKTWAWYS